MTNKYTEAYNKSISSPEEFWTEAAQDIHWFKKWTTTLDTTSSPFNRWFVGGVTNTCYNAIDIHVENGNGGKIALIYDSPVTNSKKTFTYNHLLDQVSLFAGALNNQGVKKGDRVIIYMPMVPEAVIAMLACARIGAVHSVVFGGFASNELAVRIDDSNPKVIVSASCGIEPGRLVKYKPLLDEAIELAKHKPEKCIILQRKEHISSLNSDIEISWESAMETANPADCVPVNSNDPLYILYTSGTTGQPKGIVRDTGGHIVALKWTMKNIYNINPNDVWWSASDIGWIVGHSYIVYAPLFHGCTTVLFEGKPVGTPDAGVFWRVISEHKIKSLFTKI